MDAGAWPTNRGPICFGSTTATKDNEKFAPRAECSIPTERKHEINICYIIAAFLLLMLFQSWWTVWSKVEHIPCSEFEAQVAAGKITEATVTETCIMGSFKTALEDGRTRFVATRVDPAIADKVVTTFFTTSPAEPR